MGIFKEKVCHFMPHFDFGARQKCVNRVDIEKNAAKVVFTSKIGFDTAENKFSKFIFSYLLTRRFRNLDLTYKTPYVQA